MCKTTQCCCTGCSSAQAEQLPIFSFVITGSSQPVLFAWARNMLIAGLLDSRPQPGVLQTLELGALTRAASCA
jgi:hypothetical protein